ncbi:MAG: transcription termination factor Rho [Opitutaceae bacterium]|nr:transcription termination factor Rho [Opitutaceae bacterium]
MDEQDSPLGTEAGSLAKKTRKAPVRRARGAAASATDQADAAAPVSVLAESGDSSSSEAASGGGAEAKPARRARSRRGPRVAEAAGEAGEAADSAAKVEAGGDADLFTDFGGGGAPFVASFSPDDTDHAPAAEPAADAARGGEQSSDAPSAHAGVNENESATDNRPVFVPQVSGAAPHAAGAGFGDGQGGQAREERKSWWERKKEKKRLKWLERQQAAAAGGHSGPSGAGGQGGPAPHGDRGGAPHGQGGGAPGFGGRGEGRGRDRGERDRDRPMAQPPPPSLQGPVGGLPDASRFSDIAALDAMAAEVSQAAAPLDLAAIHASSAGDLAARLRDLGETVTGMPPRRALAEQLFAWAAREKRGFVERGLLDLTDAGHGFIVHICNSYRLSIESTYVPPALVKRHGLRRGQEIEVVALPPQAGERCPAAVHVRSVMNTTPESAREVTAFEELIPYYPTSRILVEAPIHKDISMRAVDLLTPIGFGQRGLIVAPPRTGKTVLLQNIANSISHNFPDVTLILLLIDERPEEVTDFKRHTKGEVVSSTFDETPESHVHAAEMVIERARRLVELGKHVVILLDSVTRLARAYNALAGNSGKIMSGGIEANALQRPKRFFGSARNIEGGGSLTILGTALIDTNSRMDEVIFEEFKGTGNMELHLDRGLSDKRIFPAINIDRSGTRKEELIYHPDEMQRVYGLRRAMQGIPPVEAMDMFIQRLKKTRTNTEFLLSLNR